MSLINEPNEGFEKEDKFSNLLQGQTPVRALRNASITVKKENFLP